MIPIVSMIFVLVCVVGSYSVHGDLAVLNQPLEFVIIFGASAGAYCVANPKFILAKTMPGLKTIFAGTKYTKADYLELLSAMYAVFKLAKTKGMLAIEPHIENPHESSLFTQFPKFMANHHAVTFFCDYLRMITMGAENPHQIDDLMTHELEIHHEEDALVSGALQSMADGMPAMGIVAAVLGVIVTMGSISEPPEVLGRMIGAALVGTFLGILLAYGFVGPLASALGNINSADGRYFQCIKAGILAHMHGFAPSISVEFARKSLLSFARPTFFEVEEAMNEVSAG